MSIIVYQEMISKDGNPETVLNYFKENLPTTRSFDGNISVHAYRDMEDSNKIHLIGQWESRQHYAEYREFRASLGGQLGKIADVTIMHFNELIEEI